MNGHKSQRPSGPSVHPFPGHHTSHFARRFVPHCVICRRSRLASFSISFSCWLRSLGIWPFVTCSISAGIDWARLTSSSASDLSLAGSTPGAFGGGGGTSLRFSALAACREPGRNTGCWAKEDWENSTAANSTSVVVCMNHLTSTPPSQSLLVSWESSWCLSSMARLLGRIQFSRHTRPCLLSVRSPR